MKSRLLFALLVLLAMPAGMADSSGQHRYTYEGNGSGQTPVFRMDSAWLVDWRSNNEFPRTATIELQLLEADSGRVLGIINQAQGQARGLKLIPQSGAFRIAVQARGVQWQMDLIEVSEARAGQLRRQAGHSPDLARRSAQSSRRLPVGPLAGWHAPDDSLMVLSGADGVDWRLEFSPPCEGLSAAAGITFVSPVGKDDAHYDSILLDDGKRCYFDRVSPSGLSRD